MNQAQTVVIRRTCIYHVNELSQIVNNQSRGHSSSGCKHLSTTTTTASDNRPQTQQQLGHQREQPPSPEWDLHASRLSVTYTKPCTSTAWDASPCTHLITTYPRGRDSVTTVSEYLHEAQREAPHFPSPRDRARVSIRLAPSDLECSPNLMLHVSGETRRRTDSGHPWTRPTARALYGRR